MDSDHLIRGVNARRNTTTSSRMSLRRDSILVLACVSFAGLELALHSRALAYVALMAGQIARPLNGTFNNVPVLHSNQPEIVTGPGILVNTEEGQPLLSSPIKRCAMPHTPSMVSSAFICTTSTTPRISPSSEDDVPGGF